MASGDTLCVFKPNGAFPPSTSYATYDVRNGHLVLEYDASADESADWESTMPRRYAGGGLTVTIVWMADTATSGNCIWNAQFERHQSLTDDLDADGFAAVQAVTTAAPGTSGQPAYSAITFTDGAQMDSIAVGESFRMRVTRDADNASDTMAGDAQLLAVEIKET